MPVAVMRGGEGPEKAFLGPAGSHPSIFGHISRIIEGDETMVPHLAVDGQGCHDQEKAYDDFRTITTHSRMLFYSPLGIYAQERRLISVP